MHDTRCAKKEWRLQGDIADYAVDGNDLLASGFTFSRFQ
jgi:hypothetical protein